MRMCLGVLERPTQVHTHAQSECVLAHTTIASARCIVRIAGKEQGTTSAADAMYPSNDSDGEAFDRRSADRTALQTIVSPSGDLFRRDGTARRGTMATNDDVRTKAPARGSIGRDTARLSRRRMLQGSGAALAALGLLGTTGFGNPG